jgi:hypothetical protein
MLETIMRNSMPLWLMFSALYAVSVLLLVFRAVRRLRRLRTMHRQVLNLRIRRPDPQVTAPVRDEALDWIPSP